ncbi:MULTISPECIES: hypothetical protein [unclassified Mesorhizobium]|uniref:hypothetical protein n=1 Tax=unclassified Mesorhizobium TaxID=325217 RepID=UPI0003CFA137|nr:hypothetical protein [Mesorhizobium sp. L2C084A000]ESZ27974.1 hypothetical protein X734_11280 [Mesorhizobium sp. L2C084A000]
MWPFSKKQSNISREIVSSADQKNSRLGSVENFARYLGVDITPYGAGVALLSLESGYSEAETASHFAVVTLARDIREAGFDIEKIVRFAPIAMATLECLKELKDRGLMREEIWQNDTTAIGKIAFPSPDTHSWIERVLSDPTVARDRVAVSRIQI